jgi:hypothetical protein
MANIIDPTSWGVLLAWTLLIVGTVVGTTMVVVGMIEALPGIVRSTLELTMKRRRLS